MLLAASFPLVLAVIGKLVIALIVLGVLIGIALTLFLMRRTRRGP